MSLAIDLTDKVAIVTGVTSGIGKGVALMLARAGCHVAGCGTSEAEDQGAKDFVALVEREGRKAFYQQTDVTSQEALTDFVRSSVARFERIDILVSNAGANVFESPEACTDERWEFNMDLNLKAHWHLSKLAQPHLRKTKGVILIMTSNHAYSSLPNCFPYNVTKTALTGLVRTLALDWGPEIRTVGLAPGFVETEGGENWFASFDDPAAARKKVVELHPVKHLGTVEEIGAFCAFLASDFAQFITGVTYLIDGGRSTIMQDM
ncbi:SDR family NAD(P)-dependent oxidoreductase [Marinoscillum furvescens]|uniref:NAD(P)-dependent dehydrogenase (Short-subunit alcohol dehydrogenase family) n=1 Tax=Marinoscillum furvescens DSM 4134 TaxID=1122208 RepID=A0A3D9L9R4_MARFU|nr:SDR family oxidoreductase [Marinoscillum furvescens]REE02207.1 NAD(P)-dependent dehydrogenase (short-subunit alcohol dehydrogenase family) [Marinoscillum furvescens DSM 4134]